MKSKFENFLNHLKTEKNKILIETIHKGFKAINESYADLREEKPEAINQFNEMAAFQASMIGNNVLNFLNHSNEQYNHLYKEDEEPELDLVSTSQFNQYIEPRQKDEIENDLGLTAAELSGVSKDSEKSTNDSFQLNF